MKGIVCLAVALAAASQPAMGQATTWHDTNMKAIFDSGTTQINIVGGWNQIENP
jgi:hypothetical protein